MGGLTTSGFNSHATHSGLRDLFNTYEHWRSRMAGTTTATTEKASAELRAWLVGSLHGLHRQRPERRVSRCSGHMDGLVPAVEQPHGCGFGGSDRGTNGLFVPADIAVHQRACQGWADQPSFTWKSDQRGNKISDSSCQSFCGCSTRSMTSCFILVASPSCPILSPDVVALHVRTDAACRAKPHIYGGHPCHPAIGHPCHPIHENTASGRLGGDTRRKGYPENGLFNKGNHINVVI